MNSTCRTIAVVVIAAATLVGCKKPPKPPSAQPAETAADADRVGLSALGEEAADTMLDRLGALGAPAPALASDHDTRMHALTMGDDLWGHLVLVRTLLAHEHEAAFSSYHAKLLAHELGYVSGELARAMDREPEDVAAEIRFLVSTGAATISANRTPDAL